MASKKFHVYIYLYAYATHDERHNRLTISSGHGDIYGFTEASHASTAAGSAAGMCSYHMHQCNTTLYTSLLSFILRGRYPNFITTLTTSPAQWITRPQRVVNGCYS